MPENNTLPNFFDILSIVLLTGMYIIFIILFSFLGIISFFTIYFTMSIWSLIFGYIFVNVLKKNADSSKKLVVAGLIVSIISAFIIFSWTTFIIGIDTGMQKDYPAERGIGPTFFSPLGNSFIEAFVVLIFFNIPFLINYFRTEKINN